MNIKPYELARQLDIELESTRIGIDRLYDRYIELDDDNNLNKMIDCFQYLDEINKIVTPMCQYLKKD